MLYVMPMDCDGSDLLDHIGKGCRVRKGNKCFLHILDYIMRQIVLPLEKRIENPFGTSRDEHAPFFVLIV